jgi:hypothetical protein
MGPLATAFICALVDRDGGTVPNIDRRNSGATPMADSVPTSTSDAADRMRRYRQRRRDGLRCLTIELRETEIDTLIRRRLLQNCDRDDLNAVNRALYEFLDRNLRA